MLSRNINFSARQTLITNANYVGGEPFRHFSFVRMIDVGKLDLVHDEEELPYLLGQRLPYSQG